MQFAEVALPLEAPLSAVKAALYPRTGTSPENQQLTLVSSTGSTRIALDDDSKSLQAFGAVEGMVIELVDTDEDSISNQLNSGPPASKYEAKSGDAGFAAMRAKAKKKKPASDPATDDTESAEASALSIGQRVKSKASGKSATVRFIGKIEPLPKGWWVGVELDDETGRNNGEVKGVRLFTCDANKGAVMRPSALEFVESADDTVFDCAADGKDDNEL
jgi:tubulin-folding cofactor B